MAQGSKGNSRPIGGGVTRNASKSIYQQQVRTGAANQNNAIQSRSIDHAGILHEKKFAHVRNHR